MKRCHCQKAIRLSEKPIPGLGKTERQIERPVRFGESVSDIVIRNPSDKISWKGNYSHPT